MIQYQHKTALITGASSGIGRGFAEALAAKGSNLILVSRSHDDLEKLAEHIRQTYKVTVQTIGIDLSQEKAADEVYKKVTQKNLKVDILVNDAGFATFGAFHTLDPELNHREIMLNV